MPLRMGGGTMTGELNLSSKMECQRIIRVGGQDVFNLTTGEVLEPRESPQIEDDALVLSTGRLVPLGNPDPPKKDASMFYDFSVHNAEEIQRQMDDMRQRANAHGHRMESVMGKHRASEPDPPPCPPAKRGTINMSSKKEGQRVVRVGGQDAFNLTTGEVLQSRDIPQVEKGDIVWFGDGAPKQPETQKPQPAKRGTFTQDWLEMGEKDD